MNNFKLDKNISNVDLVLDTTQNINDESPQVLDEELDTANNQLTIYDENLKKVDVYFDSPQLATDVQLIANSDEIYNYVFSGSYDSLTSTKLMYKAFDYIKQQLAITNKVSTNLIVDEYFNSKVEQYFQTEDFYLIYIDSNINKSIESYCLKRDLERS